LVALGPARYKAAVRAAAWGVHLLTASGAPAGVLAMLATVRGDAQAAFAWMAYTLFVDAIDGTLARRFQVKRVLPAVDGARLDDCVDYFTYVIVPMFFALHTGMLPVGLAVPVAALVMVASGFGFARSDAKTADHFFTGFPSYWNIVVFYLYVLEWPPPASALLLSIFAIGVFVPIRYVYPSRTETLRPLTIALGILWGGAMLWAIAHLEPRPKPLVAATLLYVAYYFALSFVLTRRRAADPLS
jgi:phosphatidylcholine synthase